MPSTHLCKGYQHYTCRYTYTVYGFKFNLQFNRGKGFQTGNEPEPYSTVIPVIKVNEVQGIMNGTLTWWCLDKTEKVSRHNLCCLTTWKLQWSWQPRYQSVPLWNQTLRTWVHESLWSQLLLLFTSQFPLCLMPRNINNLTRSPDNWNKI